jgi:hypothetical protein
MNKQELKMLEEAFFPNANISLQEIFEIIELEEDSLDKNKLLFERQKSHQLSISMIPDMDITELGWGNLETHARKKKSFSASARGQLEGFLKNIQGTDLATKIKSLNDFYSMDSTLMNKLALDEKDAGGKISSVLSYLVFYKTLTKVLTNFNAASAGFNFEAFLAVMLGGKQVPTNSNTIADLEDAKKRPISLKLYAEESVEVGGSYRDLIADLAKPAGSMQYIVCMKKLATEVGDEGEIRKIKGQVGSIKFYRFNFTIENLFNILAKSSKNSRRNIILPANYIAGTESDVATTLPTGGRFPSPAEAAAEFEEFAIARFKDQGIQDIIGGFNHKKVFAALDFAKANDIWEGTSPIIERGATKLGQKKIIDKLMMDQDLFPDDTPRESIRSLALLIIAANNDLRMKYSQTMQQQRRDAEIKRQYLVAGDKELIEASVKFYNELETNEQRIEALQQTLGYVGSSKQHAGHFNLTGNMVKNIHNLDSTSIPAANARGGVGGDTPAFIGEIVIGTEQIQKMLDQVVSVLNNSVFDIFSNLQLLTTSIKTYFAGGMREDSRATAAIGAADNIGAKTQKISGVGTSRATDELTDDQMSTLYETANKN